MLQVIRGEIAVKLHNFIEVGFNFLPRQKHSQNNLIEISANISLPKNDARVKLNATRFMWLFITSLTSPKLSQLNQN